jgi:hypothetical protein
MWAEDTRRSRVSWQRPSRSRLAPRGRTPDERRPAGTMKQRCAAPRELCSEGWRRKPQTMLRAQGKLWQPPRILMVFAVLAGSLSLRATERDWIAHEAQAIVVGTFSPSPTFLWFDGWHVNGVIRVDEVLWGPLASPDQFPVHMQVGEPLPVVATAALSQLYLTKRAMVPPAHRQEHLGVRQWFLRHGIPGSIGPRPLGGVHSSSPALIVLSPNRTIIETELRRCVELLARQGGVHITVRRRHT